MAAALTCGAALLASTHMAMATLPIQKKAKALGFPATNCLYCHVDKLPKKDASKLNDRGKWLVVEKEKRQATKEVDATWLKDYVEKKPDEKKK